jgi:hypothetical protein
VGCLISAIAVVLFLIASMLQEVAAGGSVVGNVIFTVAAIAAVVGAFRLINDTPKPQNQQTPQNSTSRKPSSQSDRPKKAVNLTTRKAALARYSASLLPSYFASCSTACMSAALNTWPIRPIQNMITMIAQPAGQSVETRTNSSELA